MTRWAGCLTLSTTGLVASTNAQGTPHNARRQELTAVK